MIVTDQSQLQQVYDFIVKNQILAYDIETTSLNTRTGTVIGFGISNETEGYYLTHKIYNKETDSLDTVLKKSDLRLVLMQLRKKKLITWNGSFDLRFTKNYFDIDLIDELYIEGMLIKHTVDEERPFALKEVAKKLYGADAAQEQEEMKESIKANGGTTHEYFKADLDIMAKYCVQDCKLTYKIAHHYLPTLNKENLNRFFFDEEVMPLYKLVTIPMEESGVSLDMELLQTTHAEISKDIALLESQILEQVMPLAGEKFEQWYMNKDYPCTRTKTNPFVQELAHYYKIDLPKTPSGNFSMTEKNIEELPDSEFKKFITDFNYYLPQDVVREIQRKMHEKATDGAPIFLLNSKHHLKKLFFEILEEQATSYTDKGNPQVDDHFLQMMAEKYDFVPLLLEYNKLMKLKTSYYDRYMQNNENGKYYPRWMQHGTVSGRYSGDLQQLPRQLEEGQNTERVVKYTSRVRELFIASKGNKLVAADQVSLEPRVFAHVSGDKGLQDIFKSDQDFYSVVCLRTEKLTEYSADKKADNYLGKVNKPLRQKAKSYALGIPYGMSDYKLQFELNVSQKEAGKLIEDYLNAFPKLKKWMSDSENQLKSRGYIKSQVGRVRHLQTAMKIWRGNGAEILDSLALWKKYHENPKLYASKKYLRKQFINASNNAKNWQIQSLSASIINQASIAMIKKFKHQKLDAKIIGNVHDEIILETSEEHAEQAAKIMQETMENTIKLSVPLIAEPQIGDCYAQIK